MKTLEAKGIGRPSTYASIISTIIDRGYVYERGRALIPSWLAFSVIKLLETKFPKYVDYQFTADMENGLDQIAHGQETGRDWLTHFVFRFRRRRGDFGRRSARGPAAAGRAAGGDRAAPSTPSTSATDCTCASVGTARISKT